MTESDIGYIRMRGLPWHIKIEEIQSFFTDVNLSEDNIKILKNPDGRDSGEALVKCKSRELFTQCMAYDKQYIKTRYIELIASSEVDWNRAVNHKKARVLPVPINPNSLVILMRGLPYSVSEDDCLTFFEGVPCLGVHLTKDERGRPSGQGYAEFETAEAFSKAMEFNKKNIQNRYIELFESNVDDLKSAVYSTFGGPEPANARSVHMRGLPYNTQDQDITNFFAEVRISPIRIHRKADGTEAYAEFSTPEECKTAMKRNRDFMGPRYVELRPASQEEILKKVGPPPPTVTAPPVVYDPIAYRPPPPPYPEQRARVGGYGERPQFHYPPPQPHPQPPQPQRANYSYNPYGRR